MKNSWCPKGAIVVKSWLPSVCVFRRKKKWEEAEESERGFWCMAVEGTIPGDLDGCDGGLVNSAHITLDFALHLFSNMLVAGTSFKNM